MVVVEADGRRQGSLARLLDVAGRELDSRGLVDRKSRAADVTLGNMHVGQSSKFGYIMLMCSECDARENGLKDVVFDVAFGVPFIL